MSEQLKWEGTNEQPKWYTWSEHPVFFNAEDACELFSVCSWAEFVYLIDKEKMIVKKVNSCMEVYEFFNKKVHT